MHKHQETEPRQSRSAMRFSVIVTTHEDPWSLSLVLHALAVQTHLPGEVIIADDGSAPATAEAIDLFAKESPFPLVHVWQPHDGFRAARSRNNAIAVAECPYLALLDQDTLPHPDWLSRHASAAGEGLVSLAEVLHMVPDHRANLAPETVRNGAFTGWHGTDGRRLFRFHIKSWLYAKCRRAGMPIKNRPALRSGNFAAAKSDLLRVNGFDEAFVGWGQEDDNLGRRLYMAGVRPVVMTWYARVTHIPHPQRHSSRKSGANMSLHKVPLKDVRSVRGLDARPYSDVKVRRAGQA